MFNTFVEGNIQNIHLLLGPFKSRFSFFRYEPIGTAGGKNLEFIT